MSAPRAETLACIDRLLDRSTGEVRALAVEETASILRQLGALGDPAAVPYLLPFLAQGRVVASPAPAGVVPRLLSWWRVWDRGVTPVVHDASSVRQAAVRAIAILLPRARPADLAALDDATRRFWRWRPSLYAYAVGDIDALPLEEDHPAALPGVISFHHDGRVREEAVQRLATLDQGDELPFLLLRANDWVEPVRARARAAIEKRLQPAYARWFVDCLPLVVRLAGSARVDHGALIAAIQRLLCSATAADALRAGWTHADREVRREAFRLSARGDHPPWNELLTTALGDPDILVRLWAAREVPRQLGGEERDRMLSRIRHDPHLALRTIALEAYLTHHPDRAIEELERALLDASASVRHLARFHLAQRTGKDDFAALYRARLPGAGGAALRVAIAGLGETGTRADAASIQPFVAHPRSKIACAALRALHQLDPELGRAAALATLGDARPAVSRTAGSLIAGRVYAMDELQLWAHVERSPHLHARRAALALLVFLPRWQSLPRLLTALRLDEPALRDTARTLLAQWLHRYDVARYAPAPPSQDELGRFARALEASSPALDAELAARLRKLHAHWHGST